MVDILTGQHLVTRVDLIQDTGISLSPFIDIGQVEGALVMGLGYYTMERIVFNYEGKILTNNTWTYYPPGAKDIPIDFRVKLPKNNPNPLGVLKSKGQVVSGSSFW
jgi:xanthine dehydrogenase/oxidase